MWVLLLILSAIAGRRKVPSKPARPLVSVRQRLVSTHLSDATAEVWRQLDRLRRLEKFGEVLHFPNEIQEKVRNDSPWARHEVEPRFARLTSWQAGL
jgi:hypothetical protein